MCLYISDLPAGNVVGGYKVVIRLGENMFQSPATSIIYVAKQKVKIPEPGTTVSTGWDAGILIPGSQAYNPKFVGKTSIFKKYADAECFRRALVADSIARQKLFNEPKKNLVIVYMILSGELREGIYKFPTFDTPASVYVGSFIEDVRERFEDGAVTSTLKEMIIPIMWEEGRTKKNGK